MATDDPRAQNFDPHARSPMSVSHHDEQKAEFRAILEFLLDNASFFGSAIELDHGIYADEIQVRIERVLNRT